MKLVEITADIDPKGETLIILSDQGGQHYTQKRGRLSNDILEGKKSLPVLEVISNMGTEVQK